MSLPDAILITKNATALRKPPGFPFGLALIPGDDPLPDVGCQGLWLIDADCGMATLNDPALATYLDQNIPVTLHAEKLRDIRPFLRRKAEFKRRGYRVEVLP